MMVKIQNCVPISYAYIDSAREYSGLRFTQKQKAILEDTAVQVLPGMTAFFVRLR